MNWGSSKKVDVEGKAQAGEKTTRKGIAGGWTEGKVNEKGEEQVRVICSLETTFPLQTCYRDMAVPESCSSALSKYPAEWAKRVAAPPVRWVYRKKTSWVSCTQLIILGVLHWGNPIESFFSSGESLSGSCDSLRKDLSEQISHS